MDTSSSTVGQYSSIAVSPFGLAGMSYYDASNGDLKYAYCANFSCSTSYKYTIDNTNNVGMYTSLALGIDGLPVISYYDVTNQDLKVAHCDDAYCSTATTHAVYTQSNSGQHTSINIGADGMPVISSFQVDSSPGLRVTHCGNVDCTRGDTYAPVNGTALGSIRGSLSVQTDYPLSAIITEVGKGLMCCTARVHYAPNTNGGGERGMS